MTNRNDKQTLKNSIIMATNLFAKAKKSAPAKTTKAKDQKVRIAIEDASFFDKVSKLEQLNDTMKSAKAKADMISDELRDLGKSEWLSYTSKLEKTQAL